MGPATIVAITRTQPKSSSNQFHIGPHQNERVGLQRQRQALGLAAIAGVFNFRCLPLILPEKTGAAAAAIPKGILPLAALRCGGVGKKGILPLPLFLAGVPHSGLKRDDIRVKPRLIVKFDAAFSDCLTFQTAECSL